MNISAAIFSAAEILREAGVENPRREASSLLGFVLQKELVFLIAHSEYELAEKEKTAFDQVVHRRAAREPFQYITRRQEFYGLEFEVQPGVLIPRSETEVLVESAIKILSKSQNPTFFEIGVGSGCVAVSILNRVENATSVGVDISQKALSVAVRNAENHKVAGRLTLRVADIFDGLSGAFDLIVSNPPYIPNAQIGQLQPEVRKFEPYDALSGGADGLAIIKPIIDGSRRFLKPEGFLLIEIGFDQAERVKKFFDPTIWKLVEILPDLQNISRVVNAKLR